MKFIHLSDLHLGKRVNEFSMTEDQEYILKAILTVVSEEKPNAVLIAGDIYDKSVPSEEAMLLWDRFITRLSEKRIPVYAVSGNHDSAVRLADHGELIRLSGIHMSPAYDGTAVQFTLNDEYGDLHLYMLPFIKPMAVRGFFPDEEISDYNDACRAAIRRMDPDPHDRNVLIAHQFVTGAVRCESEDISVGGVDNVDVSVFDDFDYVALGHLHGSQHVGRDTVRYCGTPLKYSFSEKDHVKSVTVVEMKEKGSTEIREIALVPKRDLREIRGSYDELTARSFYEGTHTDDYLHVVLTDEQDVVNALGKLRIIYPNIMKLSYDNIRTRTDREVTDAEDIEKKTPLELFEELYELQNNQPMSEEQRRLCLDCIENIWEKH